MQELKTEQIVARVTPTERRHMEWLMRKTGRTASEVIRLLLRQAVAAERPDIQLDGKVTR